jgi:hypothetical protein
MQFGNHLAYSIGNETIAETKTRLPITDTGLP